jgi:hypothetical protein
LLSNSFSDVFFTKCAKILLNKLNNKNAGMQECRMQDTGYRIQDTGYGIRDAGCRMQDAGCRMQDAGCRIDSALDIEWLVCFYNS